MTDHTLPLRNVTSGAIIAALAATAAVTLTATPAGALTELEAATAQELRDHLFSAASNPGDEYYITLANDIEWTGLPAVYAGGDQITIDGLGYTITLDDSTESVLWIASTAEVQVRDLAVEGGAATHVFSLQGSTVELVDVHIREVEVVDYAVAIEASTSTLVDLSTFGEIESANGRGAALNIDSPNIEIDASEFSGNVAHDRQGGAIYANTGFMFVEESVFELNEANEHGGAIFLNAGSAVVAASTFDRNSAGEFGGAIAAVDGSVQIFDSTFSNNGAQWGGAVYASRFVNATGALFTGNSAIYLGGAVHSAGLAQSSSVWSSTFHDNYAQLVGGAFFGEARGLTVEGSTFTSNQGIAGAHIFLVAQDGTLHTFGSVYADAMGDYACQAHGGTISLGYNFDQDSWCTNAHVGDGDEGWLADPQLGELQDNYGPTHTRMPLEGSPLINKIDADTCATYYAGYNVAWDQRALHRASVADYDGGCDIGAVEYVGSVTTTIAGPQGPITVTVDGAYGFEDGCQVVTPFSSAPAGAPAGTSFPHGLVNFCAITGIYGVTVTVHVTYPSPVNSAYKVLDGWTAIPGATFSGNTVTYQITDGGPLDYNEWDEEDGMIIDPLAAGVSATFAG